MDIHGNIEKKMNLAEVRDFLLKNVRKNSETYFGFKNSAAIERVTDNWFYDNQNYDGRWSIIKEKISPAGKVLDMVFRSSY